ncbi:MAG: hypothetical protein ACMXYC_04765 [Candidatus Woesearchaeota archaeon]
MDESIRKGIAYGITSAVITTLGLFIGLSATQASKNILIGGVLSIAIADALSDAMGLHVAEESTKKHNKIWYQTFAAFATKLLVGLTFIVPILLFPSHYAVIIGTLWGIFLMTVLSLYIAFLHNYSYLKTTGMHLLVLLCVIVCTHMVGTFIGVLLA